MRGLLKFAWLPLLALPAFGAAIDVTTATGSWQVSQTSGVLNNGVQLNTVSNAVLLTPTGTLPANWTNKTSGWVGQNAGNGTELNGNQCLTLNGGTSCGAQPGTYQYTLSFVNALGGTLTGFQYTADNSISLTIVDDTGTLYNVSSPGDQQAALISVGNKTWVGHLTITATVTNAALLGGFATLPTPSGFLALGSGTTTDSGVPEPSTYAMLGLGSAALMFARLRRRK